MCMYVILIRRPFGTEPEFFVQLFVEFDESLKVPTIDTLLQKMFKEQQISFAEVSLRSVPLCIIHLFRAHRYLPGC